MNSVRRTESARGSIWILMMEGSHWSTEGAAGSAPSGCWSFRWHSTNFAQLTHRCLQSPTNNASRQANDLSREGSGRARWDSAVP